MAVDTQAVQISINVVDNNSAAAIGQVTRNIEGMGGAAQRASVGVRQGFNQMGAGALGTVEKTRLAAEEIGVRLPRAMITLISKSELAMKAMNALGGAMIAFASIQIGFLVFDALYRGAKKLWDEYQSLTKAAQDYNAEVEKTRQENFGDTHSIETTRLRIDEASAAAANFSRQAEAAQQATMGWRNALDLLAPGLGREWQGLHQRGVAAGLSKQQYEAQTQADKLAQTVEPEQYHAGIVSDIEKQHSRDAQLTKQKQINAELQKTLDLDAEEQRYNNERDRIRGNPVAPDAGESERRDKDAIARGHAESEIQNLKRTGARGERSDAAELRRLHEEALESGLRGSALYHAQEAAAIEDLKQKGIASAQAVADVHQKFHNEEMKRLEAQEAETERMRQEAQISGLTGIAHVQQEGVNRLIGIRDDENLDPAQKAERYKIVAGQTHQEMLTAEQEFTQHVAQLSDQSAEHQISGFARINAEGQKQIDDLVREYQKLYGTNTASPLYQQHLPELNAGIGAINQGTGQQTGDLARRNAEETEQLEAQARSKFLSAEKQQTAAIETEYEQRLRKFQEEKDQELQSGKLTAQQMAEVQDNYDRRVVAAAQLRDAQMVESARQAREKMAGEFTSFFHSLDHPVQALSNLGDKVAGQAAAALTQRLQTHFGGSGAKAAATTPGGILGGVFDKIAGAPHSTAPHAGVEAGGKIISLATAQISIGSASISMGVAGGGQRPQYTGASVTGGGGWTGSTGGGGWSSGGSTGGAGQTEGGSGSPSTGPSGSFAGAPAVPAYRAGGTTGEVVGGVEQGMGFLKQGAAIFGGGVSAGAGGAASAGASMLRGGAGGWSAGGSTNGGSMMGGGGIMANAGGAIGGGLGLFNAFEGSGGVGGALSGAMSGMQLGMEFGGPMGAAVGAAAGAIIGAIGFGGREKARVYWLKQLNPRIVADTLGYQQGTMDYTTAYSDMQSTDAEGKKALKAMGHAGSSYYNDTVHPAIIQAEGKLTAEQRAGRSNYTPGTAQFASGADSISRTGLAVLHERERVIPSDQNERITRALEGSADSSTRPAQSSSGWGGDIHIHAIDAKSSVQWLMQNKHNVRAAINASYGENSGGADA